MKKTHLAAGVSVLLLLLFISAGRSADITATGSGNWSSTTPDAPWPNGIVPGTNDDVDIESPHVVTVDSTASVEYIYGSGEVVMGTNATLNVLGDPAGAYGTSQLSVLDATAPGNSVIYSGNPFWASQCNYYNLKFCNTNYVDAYPPYFPDQNFNNFSSALGPVNMNIAGNMTVIGYTAIQLGLNTTFTVAGDLTLGSNCVWDCSSGTLTVMGNTYLAGKMEDLDGANGSNSFNGNVTIVAPAGDWSLGDVITWNVGGNLTNWAAITGIGYASINFNGTGNIAGTAVTIPTITINGTYIIDTPVTLTTNTPTLNGTIVFDLANPQPLTLSSNIGSLYYNSNLEVVNSGAAPASGARFQLFNAASFGGGFASTSYPNLPPGLSWNDNLYADGSLSVTGTILGLPTLTLTSSGGLLTLSWDSATYPGYHIVALTNSATLGGNWADTGSGTVSPFTTTVDPANTSVDYRLANP